MACAGLEGPAWRAVMKQKNKDKKKKKDYKTPMEPAHTTKMDDRRPEKEAGRDDVNER